MTALPAAEIASGEGAKESLFPLVEFQREAVSSLTSALHAAEKLQPADPVSRSRWARSAGVMLLVAPTGSGKTLMLGRTLEAVRGGLSRRCVWFWFAPYTGLVQQTRDAMSSQCPTLRLRDITKDRNIGTVRDGDVFVQTWGSVAANDKEARKVRRDAEVMSLDVMLAALSDADIHVGVVIDEAHLNFSATAKVAASFYLDVLKPDFTLLATATPNDEKLLDFERAAGVTVESRVIVERAHVVKEGLNKRGLMMGVLRLSEEDARFIDPEQATLTAAWTQHKLIHARLQERGLAVSPLMLVQVEDQAAGEADPIARVREKLRDIGVPDTVIAVHTSGQPDPGFHIIAHDPTTSVLIFEVAVATGFDAPRAWTLVSVRPNRGKAFGLQVVGRIMRVHPSVRRIHGQDRLLDSGYVFLTDPDIQQGLDAAVEELKAVRSSIDVISDGLNVFEFSNAERHIEGIAHQNIPQAPPPPKNDEERRVRLNSLINIGFLPHTVLGIDTTEQDRQIQLGEWQKALNETPLFGDGLPLALAPATAPSGRSYPLRVDRGVPTALMKEMLPEPSDLDGATVHEVASALFRQTPTPVNVLNVMRRQANLSLRELFLSEATAEQMHIQVRMSASRIAEAAQGVFEFNDRFDPRLLKAALIAKFQAVCDKEGRETDERSLRRALDYFAMTHPEAMASAIREAQAGHLRIVLADPLPRLELSESDLAIQARLGAYDVFPPRMNNEERAFAELIDEDTSGRVLWWLRLQENARWATTLMLPNGRRFFPDFAVGISHRPSRDHIALVEIKDDGESGRLHSTSNRLKIRATHREYKNVTWTFRRTTGQFVEAVYERSLDDIIGKAAFNIEALVHVV